MYSLNVKVDKKLSRLKTLKNTEIDKESLRTQKNNEVDKEYLSMKTLENMKVDKVFACIVMHDVSTVFIADLSSLIFMESRINMIHQYP